MFLIIFMIGIFTVNVTCNSCDSFNNVDTLLIGKNGQKFYQNINECITRTKFGNTTVVEAHIMNERIPKLGRDSVRNMHHLKQFSIKYCGLQEIVSVAFRDVPRLHTIKMTHGKLKAIPKGIFNYNLTPQLEQLNMEYNEINFIEDQSFSNISSLREVRLHHNKLEFWKSEWFENSTSLKIIDLSFNKISKIPSKAFITFSGLDIISFSYNDITTIEPDAFKGTRLLSYLGLSYNKLTVLSHNIFPNKIKIYYFAINANFLTFLSNKFMKQLTAVDIAMEYNPWTCPCLDRINYWLYIKNTNVVTLSECILSHIPVCVVPKNTQDCLDQFEDEVMLRYIYVIKSMKTTTPMIASCVNFDVDI